MSHESPLISIIIPVFNGAAYLDECLQSIRKQTYTNLEIIVVNDGSTDDSLAIIESHSNEDTRIVIANQENAGVSIARNQGLTMAHGSLIGFVDADDWIEEGMYEAMIKCIEDQQIDLVACSVKQHHMADDQSWTTHIRRHLIDAAHVGKKSLTAAFLSCELDYANWNKLFRKEIIDRCQIQFEPKLCIGEDFLFNLEYISNCHKGAFLSNTLYNYRSLSQSLFHSSAEKRWTQNCLKNKILEQRLGKRIRLTKEEEIEAINHSIIFVELPELVQFFRRKKLWFTNESRRLLDLASRDWFQLPHKDLSIPLSILLFFLRNRIYFIPMAYWWIKYRR